MKITQIQRELKGLGYNLKVDGIMGEVTGTCILDALAKLGNFINPPKASAVVSKATRPIGESIIAIAANFAGLFELKQNTTWDDPKTPGKDQRADDLAAMLKRAGHVDGSPYCMSFCEGVCVTAYKEAGLTDKLNIVSAMLSPSVMNSFSECNKRGLISKNPVPGAIMFMQKGNSWQGHAGIVKSIKGTTLSLIEANTSPVPKTAEADREGDGVFQNKERQLSFKITTGLHIIGFLNPL